MARRALLVATGTYGDPGLAALRAPTGDVEALAAVLEDDAIGAFEVRRLVDEPTEDIKKEIEGFFGAGRPEDLLLLYFSGHGVLSQTRRFYFATATTTLQWLRSTAIEDSFVNDVMQQSRARSIVLVLDCCHSGAFGKGLAPKSTLTVDVEHRFEGRGRVTLSASTGLEYAFEETEPATAINELEPGSLFTRAVVPGLQTGDADIDADGRITVDDLYDYVCRRVRERSPNQTPGMAGDVRGQIVIARSTRTVEKPRAEVAPPPPAPPPPRSPRRRPRWVLPAAVAFVAAAGAAVAVVALGGSDAPPSARGGDVVLAATADRAQQLVIGSGGTVLVSPGPGRGAAYRISSREAGVPPPPADSDRFGAAFASGDFNDDGHADLAIGTPGRDLVAIVDGKTRTGVPLRRDDLKPNPPARDFGASLVAGDFTGDGIDDLVVGVPGTLQQRVEYGKAAVYLFFGSKDGLTAKRSRMMVPEPRIGLSTEQLAAGDLDNDGHLDFVAGSRDEPDSGPAGGFAICPGQEGGPQTCEDGPDWAASVLAIGDVNGDGFGDVVEGDEHSRETQTGEVRIWLGNAQRKIIGDPLRLRQGAAGVPGAAHDGDRFGRAIAVGDIDGDKRADVVVGAPGDEEGAGSVTVLRGGSDGVAPAGHFTIHHEPAWGDAFGGALALLDFDGDRRQPELAVGVKGNSPIVYSGADFGTGQRVAPTT